MATLLLSAAGAAIGAGFGGSVLGLSGAVIGRAIGATIGRSIDQNLMGVGSDAVEIGRTDRFRLTGAGEGAAIPRVWGKMRMAGQVIWATQFQENTQRSSGSGKGTPRPSTTQYSYSISLAIALCQGEILRIGRIWADGAEISPDSLNLRLYRGTETQLPDPRIEAVEGPGEAPAYRGIAYVVIEDLDLTPYGNRVPQFSFEVVSRTAAAVRGAAVDLVSAVQAVALIPGTGEYALATTPVHYSKGPGQNQSANVHSPSGKTDFSTSLQTLVEEAPRCGSLSLIVSWFGDDLRCGDCTIRPKVEDKTYDGEGMPWRAGGVGRTAALEVPKLEGRSVYGGTPADQSVIEAIRAAAAIGKAVMFYPFILMEQLAGNGLPDPYSGLPGQAVLPWRGRITLSAAPGLPGSPDQTLLAQTEVDAFFGAAQAAHFSVSGDQVTYSGPVDWGYRRFILHYAHLCAAAGGVEAFCIGSEMRGLTTIRGPANSFPAVDHLRLLAAEVRAILGPQTKIGYAADWSEYFGHHVGEDVFFHLDPLWADQNVDFVGIDNYMPLSDWREGSDHADADWGSIYNLDYLQHNIAGGEGFDWYYDGSEGALAQLRRPIVDGAYGEDWVYRYKDLKSWWSFQHHDRVNGVRSEQPTLWVPESKPIWFTEYGCAAIDKGTNQPNKFLDPKSSESGLPAFSDGRRDDVIQMHYFLAQAAFWSDPAQNPVSRVYGGPMVAMDRAHAWAWDARPYPEFPGRSDVWSDAASYSRGHWLNGRITSQPLSAVVADICEDAPALATDDIHGVVRGYAAADVQSARSLLQPLMMVHGFDAVERDGEIGFAMRQGRATRTFTDADLAVVADLEGTVETARAAGAEISGTVRIGFIDALNDYQSRTVEAVSPAGTLFPVSQTDMPLVMTASEARGLAARWLTEQRIARDTLRLALPMSSLETGVSDVIDYGGKRYRIDRAELSDTILVEAVRVEDGVYVPVATDDEQPATRQFLASVPVFPVFLDLPLMTGQEVPHAPHVAISATPWPGSVAVWSSAADDGYEVNRVVASPSIIGVTETPLARARIGLWDRGPALRLRLLSGSLSSAAPSAVLNGANAIAIGDGTPGNWEILQFADASLVAPLTYDISMRLRGQQGTDGGVPETWPAGSFVVVLDRTLVQLDLAASSRGLERFYRVGAATRGYDDPNVILRQEAFDGVGLRPYPVAHLKATIAQDGGLTVNWIRRTRVDGDSWQSAEVPLGEGREAYSLRVRIAGTVLHETAITAPNWTASAAFLAGIGAGASFIIDVAQFSDQFGPGPFRSVSVG